MIDLKTNKRLLKVVFLFKKFALSKGDGILRRWIKNTIFFNHIEKCPKKAKYGDVIEFIILENQQVGFVDVYSDYDLEIVRLFKHSQLTFPWSATKEVYDYLNNFFDEFATFICQKEIPHFYNGKKIF